MNSEANNSIEHRIEAMVAGYSTVDLVTLLHQELGAEETPRRLRQGILTGLERVRLSLMSTKVSLAEFLLCIDTALAGLELLQPHLKRENEQTGIADNTADTTIVIGVVAGDPHDLGKNIIVGIYRAHGYRVVDLGKDVSQASFIEAVQKHNARILALSAMMSTTMSRMPSIIAAIRVHCPGTFVIIGGASLSTRIADAYGSDAYADSALTVIEATQALALRTPR